MKQRGMWPLLIVGLALILAACGGGSKGPATYAVSGTIVDVDGEPMEGVTLAFSDMTATAETDDEGNWSQTGLRGSVAVTPVFDGYIFDPESVDVTGTAEDIRFTGTETDGSVPKEGYAVSGSVLDASGHAIKGVTVRVTGADIDETSVTPDADGKWTAAGLKGQVTVAPQHDDYTFNPVFLTLDGPASTAAFIGAEKIGETPGQTYTASGIIKDEDGDPVSGVTLELEGPSIRPTTVTTDRDGKWEADNLEGEVTVTPRHDDYTFDPVSLALSGASSTADFVGAGTATTAPGTPFTLSGTILNNSFNPMPNVTITFEHDGGTATTKTDDEGKWTSPELSGTAFVTPTYSMHEFWPPSDEASAADGDPMDFTGFKQYRAGGQVVDSEDHPIPGVEVDIKYPTLFADRNATVVTDEDGRWSYDNLLGQVEVAPRDPAYNLAAQTINDMNVNMRFKGSMRLCNSGRRTDPNNPCELTRVKQINRIAHQPDYLDGHFILGGDIDASLTGDGYDFTPIGTENAPFTGTFDGDDYTIEGLHIDLPGEDYVGLFGFIGEDAEIRNVHLVDLEVRGGSLSVGGLVARNNGGTIENVSSDDNSRVSGTGNEIGGLVGQNYSGTITNAHSRGLAISNGHIVGGLVGYSDGHIKHSSSKGVVRAGRNVGGLVGYNVGDIEQSFSHGSVRGEKDVGGLVGWHSVGTIRATYSWADVTSTGGRAGGLVGTSFKIVDMSYSIGSVDGNGADNTGGLIGSYRDDQGADANRSYYDTQKSGQTGGAGHPRNTAEMTQKDTYFDWDWDDLWSWSSGVNGGYPFLQNNDP